MLLNIFGVVTDDFVNIIEMNDLSSHNVSKLYHYDEVLT